MQVILICTKITQNDKNASCMVFCVKLSKQKISVSPAPYLKIFISPGITHLSKIPYVSGGFVTNSNDTINVSLNLYDTYL